MIIKDYAKITQNQLLKKEDALKRIILNRDNDQVVLKDGTYTVRGIRRLSGQEQLVWGA